jgi:6-phosphogluconolactonase/glucosamine-6-phosphate isomerase/deaminase
MRSTSKPLKILPSIRLPTQVHSTSRSVQLLVSTTLPLWQHGAKLTFLQQGKAKKRAWQKIVDEGVTPTEAEEKYVELVESLKSKYGYDASKQPEVVGGS